MHSLRYLRSILVNVQKIHGPRVEKNLGCRKQLEAVGLWMVFKVMKRMSFPRSLREKTANLAELLHLLVGRGD